MRLFLILVFRAEQEICGVHRPDPLVISSGKFVCRKDIFGIIVAYFKKPFVFPFFCLFRTRLLCDLDIDFLILTHRCKINLTAAGLSHIDGAAPAAKLQMYCGFIEAFTSSESPGA